MASLRKMSKKARILCGVSAMLLAFLAAFPAAAQESSDEQKSEEKVKLGVIAGSSRVGNTAHVDAEVGGSVPGEEENPISASVSRTGRERCEIRVSNMSKENSDSVSYVFKALNESGAVVQRKSYSSSLKPGEADSQSLSCRPGLNTLVELTSATKK